MLTILCSLLVFLREIHFFSLDWWVIVFIFNTWPRVTPKLHSASLNMSEVIFYPYWWSVAVSMKTAKMRERHLNSDRYNHISTTGESVWFEFSGVWGGWGLNLVLFYTWLFLVCFFVVHLPIARQESVLIVSSLNNNFGNGPTFIQH